MSGFITWLEELNKRNRKARAVLRHSLSFKLGTHIPSFPYIEPFLQNIEDKEDWQRNMHYLVAALWALHWREDRPVTKVDISKAIGCCDREHRRNLSIDEIRKTTSTEKRFINLLDADCEQLPYRLRQMVALLKEQPINFQSLLNDLLYWNRNDKSVQITWARDFYKNIHPAEQTGIETELETAE